MERELHEQNDLAEEKEKEINKLMKNIISFLITYIINESLITMKVVLEKWLEKRTAEIKLECERRERLEDVFFKYINDVHKLTFPPEEYILL